MYCFGAFAIVLLVQFTFKINPSIFLMLYQTSPTTPASRQTCLVKKKFQKKTSLKRLKGQGIYLKNNAGRNSSGSITVFGKGGGHKKRYRLILFDRQNFSGVIEFIEHDPYRSANIARVYSKQDNVHFYILAPSGIARGHFIESQIGSSNSNFKIGNLFYLQDLPLGTLVHNVLLNFRKVFSKHVIPYRPFVLSGITCRSKTGGFARSAGCSALLISKNNQSCRLRLSSGEHRLFPVDTNATIGVLSNPLHNRIILGKAGRFRWLNHRPTVRGVAMNPIDHPHGGGEGKTSGGRPSVSPWGKFTRGYPTKTKNFEKKSFL